MDYGERNALLPLLDSRYYDENPPQYLARVRFDSLVVNICFHVTERKKMPHRFSDRSSSFVLLREQMRPCLALRSMAEIDRKSPNKVFFQPLYRAVA